MANLLPETVKKMLTPHDLLTAAKQSKGCLIIPVSLRRAIKRFLREREEPHMKRKVLRLSESFNSIKDVNLMLTANTSRELVEDPFKSMDRSKRWKIKSAYGDIGFQYTEDETVAYVASRMPAVFSACHRVLCEVKKRLPDFSPTKVLDFGGGTGSAFWATRQVWPKTVEKVNLVEPSPSMQRAGRSLIQGLKDLPLIHGYPSLQALTKTIKKSEREHDLVIASYVLGEIPSLKDRITIVRQLWDLTQDVLVLIEPGTPHGSQIISQMRSHILWMEKRKRRKLEAKNKDDCKDLVSLKSGVFIVAPCSHDGKCPLEKSGKYCHFAQRLQRTTSQRAYKRSKGEPPLRGFEDEKFSFVVFRRGQRPIVSWPLDGMKFDTLKEQKAKRNPEELEIDYDEQVAQDEAEAEAEPEPEPEPVQQKRPNRPCYESDAPESEIEEEEVDNEEEEERGRADLGGGWGRIMFSPIRRGKQVTMDVCRASNRQGTEGSFERVVVTQSKNPTLHQQARKSLWGDLWPF